MERTDDGFVWSDFGIETPMGRRSATPEIERTGPFRFEEEAYRSALLPHT